MSMHGFLLLVLDKRMAQPTLGWKRAQARVCRTCMELPTQESEGR
jgi:hypothetical protein